jgi:hypothetical protein
MYYSKVYLWRWVIPVLFGFTFIVHPVLLAAYGSAKPDSNPIFYDLALAEIFRPVLSIL